MTAAPDPHGNDALIARVRAAAHSIPPHHRRGYAVIIAPETGVLVVTRGDLAERLRSAGLDRQATEAMQRCRDNDAILCWIEAGTGDDGEAIAQFRTLPMPKGKSH